jgi:hypothetical protein
MGIMGTPVIDPATATMYFVVRTKENNNHFHRLHAVHVADGKARAGSPVVITATIDGTGQGGSNGKVPFIPGKQNQRPGLLLHDGVVYIAWSSHCDNQPYHGWLIGYEAATLKQVAAFNTTPNGSMGGIWMSGQGPSVDADGFIYFTTGNGTYDVNNKNYSESVLKLRKSDTGLALVDYFTPDNWRFLNDTDRDLGSGGVLVIPGTKYMATGGKDGRMYLLDRGNLGKLAMGNTQVPHWLQVSPGQGHIHGAPVHWRNDLGEFVYVMAEEDFLRQYKLDNGKLMQHRQSMLRAPDEGGGYTMPGGMLTLSANGTKDGVLWVNINISRNANQAVVPGVLRAFDASDVSKELWNSEQNKARDSYGNFAKYVPPTVYAGKVYLPTFSKKYCVYGKLP